MLGQKEVRRWDSPNFFERNMRHRVEPDVTFLLLLPAPRSNASCPTYEKSNFASSSASIFSSLFSPPFLPLFCLGLYAIRIAAGKRVQHLSGEMSAQDRSAMRQKGHPNLGCHILPSKSIKCARHNRCIRRNLKPSPPRVKSSEAT